MGIVANVGKRIGRAFGYDATESKAHRRTTPSLTQSEDRILTPEKRRKLVNLARDIRRNFEVPAWGIRTHLDFVSAFTFRAKTGNAEFDRELERFIAEWSKPLNCDVTGRHCLRSIVRLAEAHRTVDGDIAVFKLRDGRLQLVEDDRIKNPPASDVRDGERWCHGMKTDGQGRALAYAIWKRNRGGRLEFERTVPASWIYLHGYFDRYDQTRGISPMAPAINRLIDIYQNFDLALAKNKIGQLFGIAVYRQYRDDEPPAEECCDDEDPDEDFKLDVDAGPFTFEGSEKDKLEVLESKNPSQEFLSFTEVMIRVALKSIDLPYCLFDETKANYSATKAALTLYLKRCEDKRAQNRDLLDHLTRWRVGMAVANGDLDPAAHGMTFDDISWKWVPRGTPWFDKAKEVVGDSLAVDKGFQTWSDVIEERLGEDFYDLCDRKAKEIAYMRSIGLPVPGETGEALAAAVIASGTQRRREDEDDAEDED